ncbi:MAG: tetratricopeptide repeat protein [Kordiimonadaceae bacterium]|nr:tetratricopeptide repeat protein [Kordiimonadaceae bacterium]
MLALSGCAASKSDVGLSGALPAALHSEFKQTDDQSSFFGPFVAATQAQQNSQNTLSAYYYLQALDADPTSRFVADRAFFQLLVSGQIDAAAVLAEKLIEDPSETADDLVRLMYALEAFKRGDWAVARERLNDGFTRGFGFIISPLLLAWSHGAEGDIDAVNRVMAEMAKNKRLEPLVEEHLAYILDYMGETEKAAEHYDIVFAQNGYGALHSAIAYAHMLSRVGRARDAVIFLKTRAAKLGNNRSLLRESRRINNGLPPFQEVATPKGASGLVFYRLASEFARGSSPEAAIIYFRIASYLTPEVDDIYFVLGELFKEAGNTEGAIKALQSVPENSLLRKQAEMRQIELLRANSQFDEAEKLLRVKLEAEPNDRRLLVSLADLLQQQGQFAESLEFYDKAVLQIRKPVRRDWYVYFARAISYERTGQWQEAEKNLKIALSVYPDEPNTLNYLGYSWIDRGENIDEAKLLIEKAVKARPADGAIQDSLGWVYYLTGEYQKAVSTLEHAVRLEPDDATINDHLGDAYWQVGRKIEARFQWQHALDSDIEDEDRRAIELKLETGLIGPAASKIVS